LALKQLAEIVGIVIHHNGHLIFTPLGVPVIGGYIPAAPLLDVQDKVKLVLK
jgi:hypothetical protein